MLLRIDSKRRICKDLYKEHKNFRRNNMIEILIVEDEKTDIGPHQIKSHESRLYLHLCL